MNEEPDSVEEVQNLSDFSEEIRRDVEGLAWLGHLEAKIEYCGHTFVLRTLKAAEELEVALLTKEYQETLGQARAWAWAHVALALISVDGDEHFCDPLGPDRMAFARTRFKFITENWYTPIGEHLWQEYQLLIRKQLAATEAVKDLSPRSLHQSSPSEDSLTEQDDSEPEILDLLDED